MGHADNLPSSMDTNTNPSDPSNKSSPGAIRRHRGVIIVIASTLVVFGALMGIAWLVLRPQKAKFAADISGSYTELTNNFNFTLTEPLQIAIGNPNHAGFVIDSFYVSVYYHDTEVSVTTVNGPIYVESMGQVRRNC